MFLALLIISILLTLFVTKKLIKTYVNPAWFLVIYWVINIIISRLVFRVYEWKYVGLTWLMLSCLLFVLTYAFTFKRVKVKTDNNNIVTDHFSKWILMGLFCLGLYYIYLLVHSFYYPLSVFFNFDLLVELNEVAAYIRYSGDDNHTILMQILLVFVYAAPMIGGYYYIYAPNRRQKLLSLTPMIIILLILMIENTKATLLGGAILWISGWIVGSIERYQKLPAINGYFVISGILILGFLFIFSMMLRIGSFNNNTLNTVYYKFFNYGFGHMPAYDYWFFHHVNDHPLTYGQYTVFGVVNYLGLGNRVQGVFTEKLQLGFLDTNVYTANRGIITDFGLFGGMLFYGIAGVISAIAYKKVLKHSLKREIYLTILIAIFAFIAYSFMVSILTYLSYTLAFGLLYIYLYIRHHQSSLKGKNHGG